jgi:hypothetical protein
MTVRKGQTGEPAAGEIKPEADRSSVDSSNPYREMDQDRAGDVRPSDGRPAAGTGFGTQAPDSQASGGELKPER